MESIEANSIQGWLINNSPKNLKGHPIFRLVWGNDQYELVKGDNGEVRRIKKYSAMGINENWIVEKWHSPEELIDAFDFLPEVREHGSYEPIYVFEKPLNLKVVQFLVKMSLKPKSSSMLIKSVIEDEMDRKQRRVDKECNELIGEMTSSELMSYFHFGEAIIVP